MNKYQIIGTPAAGSIKVAVGAASLFGSPPTDNVVRLVSTVACFVEIGASAVAAADTSMYLAPNVPEYFHVPLGARVAVIQSSGAGFLYITPMV